MRSVFTFIFIFFSLIGSSQNLSINEGFFTLHKHSTLSLKNTNLEFGNGSLIGQDTSNVAFIADSVSPQISGYGYFKADSLTIGSEVNSSLYLDVNHVKLNGGNLNQENVILDLRNQILNEDKSSNIKGGTIRLKLQPKANNFTQSGNLGLQMLFSDVSDSITLTRQNRVIYTSENYSINRLYALADSTNSISEVNFYYFNNELENLNSDKLQVYTSTDLFAWKPQQILSRNPTNGFIHAKLDGFVKYFSVFEEIPEESFFIPNGFSPNNDGVNDFFEILGLEDYPNNKLIVFDGNGAILFEGSPYQNNWDGFIQSGSISADNGKLNTGTYYYFFYKDADKKNDVEKGFIELRSGRWGSGFYILPFF